MSSFALIRRIVSIICLIIIGVIHLMLIQSGLRIQLYLGILFIIDVVAAFVGALWLALEDVRLAWLLGGLAALGPFVGYIVTRTVGLPGIPRLSWQVPMGFLSLVLEAIVVVLAISALAQPIPTQTPMHV
ncbi:MAG TPA: hypothetical protein VKV20_20320 [Ktedonobacteraceae bacterium]|jgi:hypothetical protein|nr:hypothetical protein [Ktedonobacteraceae bacterium]